MNRWRWITPFWYASLAMSLVVFAVGCSWWSSEAPKVKPAVFSCASAEVSQIESNLAATVIAALESASWEAALIGLARQLGSDGMAIVSCIVSDLISPKPAYTAQPIDPSAKVHGKAWLTAHP